MQATGCSVLGVDMLKTMCDAGTSVVDVKAFLGCHELVNRYGAKAS
jgi:hypothetical protein